MEMTGEERIRASREAVYAALNDAEILKQCIPGCKEISKKSDTELEAKVGIAIGPVKATFSGNVTLSDLDPPNGYTISGEGKGGPAGFAKGGAVVRLAEDGDDTVLTYEAKADVGGKLAQLGSRLIDSTSKKLAKQFFTKFNEVVSAPAEETETQAEAESAPVEDTSTASSASMTSQPSTSSAAEPAAGGMNKMVIGAVVVIAVIVAAMFLAG